MKIVSKRIKKSIERFEEIYDCKMENRAWIGGLEKNKEEEKCVNCSRFEGFSSKFLQIKLEKVAKF